MEDAKRLDTSPARLSRRQVIASAAVAAGALAIDGPRALAAADDGISRNEEAIHHEVVIKATRKRVYEALTDTKQFDKIVQLSGAMKSGMKLGTTPTAISKEAGGTFTAFGGHILGRQIELVQDERIVQAWRAGNWDAGVFSIARFSLIEQGAQTKLVFDHVGFPKGQAEHLAEGWRSHYWEPLAKSLE